MRGRKPKPTALKLLDGTRADRINHDEPAMPPASIEPPDWLDETALGPIRDLESVLSMKTETLGAGEGGAGR